MPTNILSVYGKTDKERMESGADYDERPDSTFYADFMVCDLCYPGNEAKRLSAIKDTYKRAFDGWKDDVKYFTELSMALNHLIWHYYNKEGEDSKTAALYNDLWQKADGHAREHFTGEDATYYFRVTD